jgi:hypothetical protein
MTICSIRDALVTSYRIAAPQSPTQHTLLHAMRITTTAPEASAHTKAASNLRIA